MPDEAPSPTLDRGLTTNIVAAYVRRNQIGADQLPIVISTVHQALPGLGKSKAETEIERTPAVSIRQSVHRDYVVCLDCGWRGQMLKRHLATGHGLSVEQYRVRWTLPREHPITAPSYSERRSGLPNSLALGGVVGHPVTNQSRSHHKIPHNTTAISTVRNAAISDGGDLDRIETNSARFGKADAARGLEVRTAMHH
jgi:predicted transcriptional regulator